MKIILVVIMLIMSSSAFAVIPKNIEEIADTSIERYCPKEGGWVGITNQKLCFKACNLKVQLEILEGIKKLNGEED